MRQNETKRDKARQDEPQLPGTSSYINNLRELKMLKLRIDEMSKILKKENDTEIKFSKFAKLKSIYPNLRDLHLEGVSYVQLCSALNEQEEWINVDSLRSMMSRIRVSKNMSVSTSKPRIDFNHKETSQKIIETPPRLASPSSDDGLNIQRSDDKSKAIEKSKPLVNIAPGIKKYDVARYKTLTRDDLGLPEQQDESKTNE